MTYNEERAFNKRHTMSLAAAALAKRKPGESLKQVAEGIGISQQAIDHYLEEAPFRELVRKLTDDALTEYMPEVDQAMFQKAIGGNVQAATYLAKRSGRLTDVTEDKSFSDWCKKANAADEHAIQFFMEHQRWPDEDAVEMMPEPDEPQ